jgi:hypothetical protein
LSICPYFHLQSQWPEKRKSAMITLKYWKRQSV